jgi:NAD(P)-dependent dehydrogenase (short-subunit alcohol dehydrogenase family)
MQLASLQDSVAIVAGAGRGIGETIAAHLGAAGATVAVVDIEPERAEAVTSSIGKAGGQAIPISADLMKAADVERTVEEVASQLGHVDILVNNAGGMSVYGARKRLESWSEEEWDNIVDRNLRYVFLTCRAALPQLRRSDQSPAIVNIASINALRGSDMSAAYGAGKAGVISLTRSLAIEYGRYGIRVNAVAPGVIHSPANPGAKNPAVEELIPLGRAGGASDIAAAVTFLAGPGAPYITGQILAVDGGLSAKHPLHSVAPAVEPE